MVDLGGYLLGVVQLALVVVPVGFSAFKLRQRFLPAWTGAPARLVETIVVSPQFLMKRVPQSAADPTFTPEAGK